MKPDKVFYKKFRLFEFEILFVGVKDFVFQCRCLVHICYLAEFEQHGTLVDSRLFNLIRFFVYIKSLYSEHIFGASRPGDNFQLPVYAVGVDYLARLNKFHIVSFEKSAPRFIFSR